ncbi:hypothetical protein [Bacillus sp. 165]|uniref:hypothetical protein n=1 Tax=Bacillus sp. 165 TaxID=1529117 RepID=UPI001ADB1135|nr:hypothetical protein [Bacillus sp. 165]MBO9129775.1 hypothetical protein [Bacillus sp. 165]
MKKMIAAALTGMLIMGGATGVSKAFANEDAMKSQTAVHNHHDHLFRMAEHFGIKTEGKTEDQIRKELQAKKHDMLIHIAQKQGIDTKGKTDEQIHKELLGKRHERLLEKAKRFGISVEGKNDFELQKEVREAWKKEHEQVLKGLAKKLGIQTEGKTREQIWNELKKAAETK